jgi:copper chaperone CopZ
LHDPGADCDRQAEIKMVPRAVTNKPAIERVTLPITDLSGGGGDPLSIERALLTVEGVRNAYVNPAMEMAYVEYDPSRCNPEQLTAAIAHIGYHAGPPVMR